MSRRALVLAVLAACVEKPGTSVSDAAAAAGNQGVAPVAARDAAPLPPERPEAPPPQLPTPPPGKRRAVTSLVADAYRVAAGDLDGDRQPDLALASETRVWVIDRAGKTLAEVPADAGPQILTIVDADGDGRQELAVGWGETGKHRGAKAKVSLFRLKGGKLVEEVVHTPTTARNEIVAILPLEGGLLLAWFESKYMVNTARAKRDAQGGWSVAPGSPVRMATSYALADVDGDRAPDVVVGRIYGDSKDEDGDAFVARPDGSRQLIPTTRGVRSLVTADSDGDGKDEVFLADGWHQNYGKYARALLTWARLEGGVFQAKPIEESAGQFTFFRLIAADLDRDHHPELIAQGSHVVRVYKRRGDGWTGITVAGLARDVAVSDGQLLVLGDQTSESIDLAGAL